MTTLVANLLLVLYIYILTKSLQLENDTILEEARQASQQELLISSCVAIGGFYIIHLLMFGQKANSSLASQGIFLIIIYELVGFLLFLLFRENFLRGLHWANENFPVFIKIPIFCEFVFCCYLLVINIL